MKRPVWLLWRCTRHQNRLLWRTPIAAFFALVFPLLMLVTFMTIFGDGDSFGSASGPLTTSMYYTSGLAVFSAATATYTNIAISVASRREIGILKRVRGTPLPPWAYLGGVLLSAVWVATLGVAATVTVGAVFYDVDVEAASLPVMLLVFVVGSSTFAALGLALASVAHSVSSAVPIAQATILPVSFISDVMIPLGDDPPFWLELLGDVFPFKHFGLAFREAMNPLSDAPVLDMHRVGVLLLWLAVGVGLAVWRFNWETPTLASRRSRRGARSADSLP